MSYKNKTIQEYQQEYYLKNRERKHQYYEKYYNENLDYIKSYQKHYYQMLKLAKKAYYHDYYIKNKSYIRSYQYAKYHNSKAGVEIVKENFKISINEL
jgi:hypothetical protein